MAKQQRYNVNWKNTLFNAGGTEIIDLPIGLDIESLQLYLAGSITLSGATAPTGVRTEGLAKLFKRIEILFNGETIHTYNGELLTHGNFAREGGVIKTNPGITIAVQPCEIVAFLDFSHIRGIRPKDSNLRTKGARQFQLKITWGAMADIFTGTGWVATPALNLATLVRSTKEVGDNEGQSVAPEVRRITRMVEKVYAANTQDRIPLDPQMLYRGIVIRCESSGELSAGVLNSVRVQLGNEIIYDATASQIVDMNIQDNGFNLAGGYYFIDFAPCSGGLAKLSDFLDLHGHDDAYIILDVVGGATNKVQMAAHQYTWDNKAIALNRELRAKHGQ